VFSAEVILQIKAVSNSPEQPEVGVLMARMLDENKEALGTLQDAANDGDSLILSR